MKRKYWVGSSDLTDQKPTDFITITVTSEEELDDAMNSAYEFMENDFHQEGNDDGDYEEDEPDYEDS